MNKLTILATALTAGAAIALAAPAAAAPTGGATARDTVASLERQGYAVVVNRLSERSLDVADVVSVSKGLIFNRIQLNPVDQGGRHSAVSVPMVYVSIR